jgi:glycosyltransferase involved in cell wall biosynthesis
LAGAPGRARAQTGVKRLRVGLITPGFSAAEADWCIPAQLDLVRALAARHDVRVFALRYPHTRRGYSVYAARVTPFGAAQSRGVGRLAMLVRVLARLRREHRREPFDVLHALWAHEPGALAAWAGRSLNVPVVTALLGGELADLPAADYGGARSPVTRRLTAFALRRAARVTVGSRFLGDMAEHAGVWDARFSVWPLGVETRRFHPRVAQDGRGPTLDGRPALLHVATLIPVKGQATLLRAFARLHADRPGARLHIAGDGPLQAALEMLARALGVADAVRFHGALRHDALPAVYRQADAFVLSSLFESQCLAALEALACGCRVAGTAVGVMPVIAPAACLAPPEDDAALAAAVARALDGPPPRPLPAHFELTACIDALETLYGAALAVP